VAASAVQAASIASVMTSVTDDPQFDRLMGRSLEFGGDGSRASLAEALGLSR
jgi:hypothetical protein